MEKGSIIDKIQISDNPVLGIPRFVQVLKIEYLDFTLGEAKILFRLEQGVNTGINKEIWVIISDKNRVTNNGVVVSYANIPRLENETEEDYIVRYNQIKADSHPEFTFWWENGKNINLEQALNSGILLLDNLNYFDYA